MTIIERIKTKPGYRVLAVIALMVAGMNYDYASEQKIAKAVPIHTVPSYARMTSHIPASTATAIALHSKRPKTMAAIAAVETGKRGNVHTRGDHGASRGVFQVQPHHWGYEGDTLEAQVKKADKVFDALVQEHGYHGAVKAWNGTGKQAERYRNRVYARLGGM